MRKISLANIPTKINYLEKFSKETGKNVYIKRDDYTGTELSGNKIRKLEYSIAEAQSLNADMLITCGGIQSNHCRATVASATMLGMKSAIMLKQTYNPRLEGNYFLDVLYGTDIHFCSVDEYAIRDTMLKKLAEGYRQKGYNPYIIPEGASNGIGTLGYYSAYKEIIEQEKEMGVTFDTIVIATGSGGTSAGLNVGNRIFKGGKRIISFCVAIDDFQIRIANYCNESLDYLVCFGELKQNERDDLAIFNPSDIEINRDYIGAGYALSRPEEIEFITNFARSEGILLDPVYTGKAMFGLWSELKSKERLKESKNILFIHTGGLFGLFPSSNLFGIK